MLVLIFAAGAFCFQGCGPGNNTKDTVDQAMDQNDEIADNAHNDMGMSDNDDSDFAVKAANSGISEVKASEIAQEKAQNQSVKDFAAKMVQEHTKVNEELKLIAANKNIVLPTAPGEDHLEDIEDLHSYSGADFDREYMDMMVDDHQDAVDLFDDASEDLEDVELKNFAAQNLPVLKQHLEEAQAIQDALKN